MQEVCIHWGKSTSGYFTISIGVRQGGIHSPKLFSLYMNPLTDKRIDCNFGCYNHIMHADDICLMAPI